VAQQGELTKGKAALLLVLSAVVALVSARQLRGCQLYAGLAVSGAAIFFAFTRWNRK
jgi:hypothetical protein